MRPNVDIPWSLQGNVKEYAENHDLSTDEAYKRLLLSGLKRERRLEMEGEDPTEPSVEDFTPTTDTDSTVGGDTTESVDDVEAVLDSTAKNGDKTVLECIRGMFREVLEDETERIITLMGNGCDLSRGEAEAVLDHLEEQGDIRRLEVNGVPYVKYTRGDFPEAGEEDDELSIEDVDKGMEDDPPYEILPTLFKEQLDTRELPIEGEGSIHERLVAEFNVDREAAEAIVDHHLDNGHIYEAPGGTTVKWVGN